MSELLSTVRHDLLLDEGLRLVVYDDATGRPLRSGDTLRGQATIGIGRNVSSAGLTDAEALYLCDQDIRRCIHDLQTFPWFARLAGGRLRAVINLRFQLGAGTFRTFARFLDAMAREAYVEAVHELITSRWYEQVAPTRRERIVRQIRDGS
jgi:lysozyme